MHRKVLHRLLFAWGPSIGMPKGLLTALTTQNIFISSFNEQFFNQLQKCTTHIQKQTVLSNGRGQSSTLKIEEEASQKNQADETC